MKTLITVWKKPYGMLTLAALLVILVSFSLNGSIDIHLHDTYFVITQVHLFWAVALLLLLLAFFYRALEQILFSRWLTWLHIVPTLTGLALLVFPFRYQGFTDMPRRYYEYSAWEAHQSFQGQNQILSLIIISWFLAQFLFLLHILLGLLRLFSRRR
jgi:cytochrome c oxidase subunit I